MRRLLIALCLALAVHLAPAGEALPLAADPMAEKRLRQLSENLRCLVCQNQSIADSHAELADDLRREIRNMIKDGRSDEEIIDFMVARYGDFVLYLPPFKATTALLWVGPLLLLLVGLLSMGCYLKRRSQRVTDDAPLSEEDTLHIEILLNETKNS
ncbi:MAG: cytochrome c-type biogenesis protein CcmH [Rhodocyclaceae bacterium]|nr:cytochrome c-type biogenesis protein CcmH [Rhodocyclaceae bacterium]